MLLRLSPIEDLNDPFLLTVYASTRSDEMSLVPWTAEQKEAFLKMQLSAQHAYYLEKYPNAAYQLITLGEKPVGRLYVLRRRDSIRILDVTVLPGDRGRGIGGQLIADLVAEASESNSSLEIYIENFNPAARFFERRGFRPVAEEGVHVLWRRPAAGRDARQAGA